MLWNKHYNTIASSKHVKTADKEWKKKSQFLKLSDKPFWCIYIPHLYN